MTIRHTFRYRITSENVKFYCAELRREVNVVSEKFSITKEQLKQKLADLNDQYDAYIHSRQINHKFVLYVECARDVHVHTCTCYFARVEYCSY